jgi:hypothetical protein
VLEVEEEGTRRGAKGREGRRRRREDPPVHC